MATELGSVVIIVPLAFKAAKDESLPKYMRTGAAILGVASLIVDGGLLLRWLTMPKDRRCG